MNKRKCTSPLLFLVLSCSCCKVSPPFQFTASSCFYPHFSCSSVSFTKINLNVCPSSCVVCRHLLHCGSCPVYLVLCLPCMYSNPIFCVIPFDCSFVLAQSFLSVLTVFQWRPMVIWNLRGSQDHEQWNKLDAWCSNAAIKVYHDVKTKRIHKFEWLVVPWCQSTDKNKVAKNISGRTLTEMRR